MAARLLGPSGLGGIVIGFSVYAVALSVQRALLSEPFVVTSATFRETATTSMALTVSITIACSAAVTITALALVVPNFGHAFALFAPWVATALIQDFARSTLFRDHRGAAATLNDATWLLVMAAGLPLVLRLQTDWAVVSWWGAGAAVGALLGVLQIRARPSTVVGAWVWWKASIWQLGRWFFAHETVYAIGSQAGTIVIGTMLGTAALGGLRSIQTVFAPLSLFTPAVALPGLPLLAQEAARAPRAARRLATYISLALAGLTFTYVVVLGLGGKAILTKVFGNEFDDYAFLIIPIGLQQVVLAVGEGFQMLLKVMQRGKTLLAIRATTNLLGLSLVSLSCALGSLGLVAWSTVVARSAATLLMGQAALRSSPASNPKVEADLVPRAPESSE